MIKRRDISILLLLSFSVMVGHSVIPHHHHSEIVVKTVTDPCPVDHEDHHNTDEGDGHCHAFNELLFNKTDLFDILKDSKRLSLHAAAISEITKTCLLDNKFYIYFPLKIPGPSVSCFGSVTLRGPPASA
jgi:hypothetical protein